MKMTYRTRRRLRRLGIGLVCLLLAALVVGVCWFIWLERFVVYDSEGAHLIFDYTSPEGTAQIAQPPQEETVSIHYNEGDEYVDTSAELTQIHGYYATTEMLAGGVDKVKSTIPGLPEDSVVMLDLKSGFGNFYYSSGLADAPVTNQLDVTEVDELIRELTATDLYVIARVPAFRDRAFGLENTNYGLAHTSGRYLWADDDNCYWLNPASNGTLSWLISVASELRSLGFDEVVFTEFRFPDTESIQFKSSMTRQEALEAAAKTLVDACATNRFAVSFESANADFVLPEGRCRLYLINVDAAKAADVAEASSVPDKAANLVFLTETNDTRFNSFGTMRPMPVPN